jgi:predicted nucleic acid-binding protein
LIVLDASAAVELVLRTDRADRIAARALDPAQHLHAPHLIDIELTQVLRRLVQSRELAPARAELALLDFAHLTIERHPHTLLLRRIWVLRSAMSAYDGAYVALAEALAAPLLTCDERLARAHGHRANIELVAALPGA